eukprot:COSAG01_NODE_42928_length_435_cov_0.619048_1_plen_59_part_10
MLGVAALLVMLAVIFTLLVGSSSQQGASPKDTGTARGSDESTGNSAPPAESVVASLTLA